MNDRGNIGTADTLPYIYIYIYTFTQTHMRTTYAPIRRFVVKAPKVSTTELQWLCSDTLKLIGVLQASEHSLHIRCRLANVFHKAALTLQFRQQNFHFK